MYYGVVFTYINLFRTMPVSQYTVSDTNTSILSPVKTAVHFSEDSEPTGLKVDIAKDSSI